MSHMCVPIVNRFCYLGPRNTTFSPEHNHLSAVFHLQQNKCMLRILVYFD